MIGRRKLLVGGVAALITRPALAVRRHGSAFVSSSMLKINLSFDASFSGAPANYTTDANTAAALLMAAFPNTNATLTIQCGYNEVGGQPMSGVNSAATDIEALGIPYTTVRSAMQAKATASGNASLTAAANSLPSGSTIGGQTVLNTAWGVCKALGFFGYTNGPMNATDTSQVDGQMGITSGWGTTVGSTVFIFLHEFTHAMGRVPGSCSFNLTRFRSPGVREVGSAHGATVYFSLDNGTTNLATYDTNNDPSDFLNGDIQDGNTGASWASFPSDSFDAFVTSNTVSTLTTADLKLLNSMGYL